MYTACVLQVPQQYSMRSASACKRVALLNAPLTWRPLMRARASHDTAWPQPSPHPSAQLTDCQPSPTLSPTDPVPRDLLTLCPAASSGPYLQTALPCYVRLAVLFICLCPSLCVYVYVYAYAYAYVYVYVRVYLHVNTYVYTCISCILHLRLAHASCCTMSYLTIYISLSPSDTYIHICIYLYVYATAERQQTGHKISERRLF